MSVAVVSRLFALLALSAGLAAAVVAGAGMLRRVTGRLAPLDEAVPSESRLWLAWLIAAVATAGSLYYSEVVGFVPCRLCWFQRIAMYPLSVVLLVAALRRDVAVRWYALPVAAVGALISSYHYLLQWFPQLETASCDPTAPCAAFYVREFGFVSIPFMALMGFLAIVVGLLPITASDGEHDRPSPHSTSRPASQPRWIFGAVILFVAVAMLVAALTAGGSDGASADGDTPEVDISALAVPEVSGEPLSPLNDPTSDPAVGEPAPAFTASTFAGERISVQPGQDGPMILLFLAHWCPHCQREVPVVQDWIDGGGLPEDVQLYAVATAIDESRPNYPPDVWLEREGWTPTTVVDDPSSSLAQAYGLNSFPFWVLVDADGTVSGRLAGSLPADQLDQIATSLSTP